MKLTKYSKDKLYRSFDQYAVDKDYADPIYNYLVFGHEPGSFFTALLANDFMGAISHSHPANTISALKNLVIWIINELPEGVIFGSREVVNTWLSITDAHRRAVLEHHKLIYSEFDEVVMVLKDEPIQPYSTFII